MSEPNAAQARAERVWGLLVGAPVVDAAGRRVGRVARVTPTALIVRCGYLLHTEVTVARDDVDRYEGGKLVLKARRV